MISINTNYLKKQILDIKTTVGEGKVLCGLSGGVDSSVCAVLVHRAIGDNLICVFVDHGLLRKGEADDVEKRFKEKYKMNFIRVDARKRFLLKLKGVTDPEKKRKIIGKEFILVFEEVAKKLRGINFLLQGTIYPDILESGSKGKKKGKGLVKSHHNVGGLPKRMKLNLLEPIKFLYKNEVRKLGLCLGLPRSFINRWPFPGPGLAVRCLGAITEEKLKLIRESDAIFRDEIRKSKFEEKIWQGFTFLPNIKSVGVKGGKRTYAHTIGIRAVSTTDAMTADWVEIPYKILRKVSSRILKEVTGVSRVVYDISTKPPATIEWE